MEKEKEPKAISAFLTALKKLGVSSEKFFDRNALLEEAKNLSKKIPSNLSWFPFDQLPSVSWSDTGEPVEKDIIIYFIIKTCKLKSPSPDPLLKRYCSSFKANEKEELGKFILQCWINRDSTPLYTHEEASEMAEKDAQALVQIFSYRIKEELYEEALREYRKKTLSAIKEKGILALCASCCGTAGALEAGRYIKKWGGSKLAQSKALVEMISWIDSPSAIQLLISISKRGATRTIKKMAEKFVRLISQRKGWTEEELSDRTIPTGSFSKEGKIEVKYGERKFILELTPNWKIKIKTEDGKILKSLPSCRKNDDREKVKEAKKILSNARKELKSILTIQKERLYDAMCLEREWLFSHWENFLKNHPVVGKYCQKLIWGVFEDNKVIKSFRPLDDGTLTDYEDEDVQVESDKQIRLLHSCNTPENIEELWMKHMEDYEIIPLFQQFNKEFCTLSDKEKNNTEITDFRGYLIDSLALRGQTKKFGYNRGEVEDGACFFTYKKDFPQAEITAVIEFSGSFLPEQSRTVALKRLFFIKKAGRVDYYRGAVGISLSKIPPILLCECRNELRVIAGRGTGYDKDWEKKIE